MFLLAEAAEGAHQAAEHAEEAEHHSPIIVQLVNHWFGEQALAFELKHTKPKWDYLLGYFGTNAESAFGPYPLVHGDVFHRVHPERGHHLDHERQTF
jgi:hypothetical protein